MTKITNAAGTTIDFNAAANLMDDELREGLHDALAPTNEQAFFEAYCAAHLDKFGADFEPNKANPVW